MPETNATGYVLGFDFGLKHIGVAVGQAVTGTASPLPPLTAKGGQPRWSEVRELLDAWRPTQLVVGLPLNMDDTDNPITVAARKFAQALESRYPVPVAMVDERLTTREAMELTRGDRERSHGAAAVLMVESYLR